MSEPQSTPPAPPLPSPTPPPNPAGGPPPAHDQNAEVMRRLERIEQQNRVRGIQDELGVTGPQAAAVNDLMLKHQLPAQQAHILAQAANPALFQQPNPGEFQPGIGHGAARPAPGMPPPPPPAPKKPEELEDERWKRVNQLSSRRQAEAINNELGHLAAEAAGMGDAHKLLDI